MKTPLVSIIIINWNGRHLLEKCLPSVFATNYASFEVILADNASSDDSIAWAKDQFPSIKTCLFESNHGYAKGNNLATKVASGKYLVWLNNDVEVTANWLSPLVEFAENNQSVGVLQPKILQYEKRNFFEYAGASGGFIDKFGFPFTRGRIFFTLEEDLGQYDTPLKIFWASGACLFFRKDILDKVGMLDEQFFMHMEEIDWCWRVQRAGYEIWCLPESCVYHIGGGSLPQDNPQKLYYNYRNSLLMLYKNLPIHLFYKRLFMRLFLDGVAFIRLLFTSPTSLFAMLRAYKDAYSLKKNYTPLKIDSTLPIPLYHRSIVVAYFIYRQKTFVEVES